MAEFVKLPDDPEPFVLDGRITEAMLDDLLEYAYEVNASDINFKSDEVVRISLYGILRPFTNRILNAPEVANVLGWMFGAMGSSSMNSGRDVDGSFEIRPRGDREYPLRFRYNATNGRNAIQITMRTLPSSPPDLMTMNVPQQIIDNLRPKSGLIYIAGPTGSGKSTLMAACIRYLINLPDRPEDNFVNSGKFIFYERPIEFIYDDLKHAPRHLIHQAEVGRDLRTPGDHTTESEEWAYAVRNALRRTPDVAIIGEARDAATIQGCINLGLSGH
jgi:defect-in-organelle-trafficking protein DotB